MLIVAPSVVFCGQTRLITVTFTPKATGLRSCSCAHSHEWLCYPFFNILLESGCVSAAARTCLTTGPARRNFSSPPSGGP